MVTRSDIADSLEGAFGSGPLTRAQILEAAASQEADQEVIAILEELPAGHYSHLRDLWRHLSEVPRRA